MFTGEYRHAVDDKGRVAVPVRFRGELATGLFVCKWIDSCLALFPRPAWDQLATKVASLPGISSAEARSFQRYLFASAFEVELDRQGRLLVPPGLREWAQLETDVTLVGSNDHVELWEPTRWAQYSAPMDSPEVHAQHLQGLGI